MTFGERLRKIAEEKCITQVQIAEGLGIRQQSVSAWFTDQQKPHKTRIQKLSQILGVKIERLTVGE